MPTEYSHGLLPLLGKISSIFCVCVQWVIKGNTHNPDTGYQGPEHTPLSWKLCEGELPEKPLQGLSTFLWELLLGWALTLVFWQSYVAPMPIPGQAPCWSESWPWHVDLTSWLNLGLVSSPWTRLSVSTFGWPCLLCPDLPCLPSSGTVDLGPVWGDTTLPDLLSSLAPGSPSLVEHSVLAARWKGHLSCNAAVKKKRKKEFRSKYTIKQNSIQKEKCKCFAQNLVEILLYSIFC